MITLFFRRLLHNYRTRHQYVIPIISSNHKIGDSCPACKFILLHRSVFWYLRFYDFLDGRKIGVLKLQPVAQQSGMPPEEDIKLVCDSPLYPLQHSRFATDEEELQYEKPQ